MTNNFDISPINLANLSGQNGKTNLPNHYAHPYGNVPPADYDKVELGNIPVNSGVYTKSDIKTPDAEMITSIKVAKEGIRTKLREYVEQQLWQQGIIFIPANKMFNRVAEIRSESTTCAETAPDQEADYGIDAVRDRIVDFAIAVSGNDKAKLDDLKTAINTGFEEAEKSFGGELPDICTQTYDEIINKLDKWAEQV